MHSQHSVNQIVQNVFRFIPSLKTFLQKLQPKHQYNSTIHSLSKSPQKIHEKIKEEIIAKEAQIKAYVKIRLKQQKKQCLSIVTILLQYTLQLVYKLLEMQNLNYEVNEEILTIFFYKWNQALRNSKDYKSQLPHNIDIYLKFILSTILQNHQILPSFNEKQFIPYDGFEQTHQHYLKQITQQYGNYSEYQMPYQFAQIILDMEENKDIAEKAQEIYQTSSVIADDVKDENKQLSKKQSIGINLDLYQKQVQDDQIKKAFIFKPYIQSYDTPSSQKRKQTIIHQKQEKEEDSDNEQCDRNSTNKDIDKEGSKQKSNIIEKQTLLSTKEMAQDILTKQFSDNICKTFK